MKYFVTGATGFIGGRLARTLVEMGHQVVTIARTPEKAGDLVTLGIEVHKGDLTDKESMRAPMTGVDGVFHVAAWYKLGERDTSMAQGINVDGSRNVFELMRELNIPKGVYTSTLAVNSDTHGQVVDESYSYEGAHLSEYDRTKWEAHHRVAVPMMQQGLPLVIVMPGLVYGVGDTSSVRQMFIQYLQRKLPMLPQRTALTWAHIDDIAQGHILAMEKGKPGETYIIAGPVHTVAEGFEVAERITGIPAPKIQASPTLLRIMGGFMGVVEKIIPVPETMAGETLRAMAGTTYIGSNAKAKRELGYNPRPMEEGLPEVLLHEMNLLGMSPKTSD